MKRKATERKICLILELKYTIFNCFEEINFCNEYSCQFRHLVFIIEKTCFLRETTCIFLIFHYRPPARVTTMEKIGGKTKLLLMQINKFISTFKIHFCCHLLLYYIRKPGSSWKTQQLFIVLASQIAVLVERKICCKN